MAKLSRSLRLLKNAEAALVAAVEIYNKPSFAYREETFAILALNAWELLLKSKLLAENGNRMRCLYAYEKRPDRKGTLSRKVFVKRNRTGSAMTIGLEKVIDRLTEQKIPVAQEIKTNLVALTEIRDNAIHYINAGPDLAKQVLEIGTATVINFIEITKNWFKVDYSRKEFFIMPIGFMGQMSSSQVVSLSDDQKSLIHYLADLLRSSPDVANSFHVSLELKLSFKRSAATSGAVAVTVSSDADAVKVILSEEDVRQSYPWDYADLTGHLKSRYSDFKENSKYHRHRRNLALEKGLAMMRYLDPGNPKSSKKEFYSPNILRRFDEFYTAKTK